MDFVTRARGISAAFPAPDLARASNFFDRTRCFCGARRGVVGVVKVSVDADRRVGSRVVRG